MDPATEAERPEARPSTEDIKRSVQGFYDSVGWQRSESEVFEDANRYEDLRRGSAEHVHRTNHRVSRHLAAEGRFLLDVASGPVQFDDFVAYSRNYRRRVCVDLSLRALREARARLADHGLYVLADITRLPFRDGCFDGTCSLHTIYHVPAEEQGRAFEELHRTLAPSRTAVVVYAWGKYSPLMFLFDALPHKLAALARPLFRRGASDRDSQPNLYFHPRSQSWFRSAVAPHMRNDVFVWRSLSNFFLRRWVPDNALGSAFLRMVYRAEEWWPRALGWLGNYPLIVIRKGGDMS